MNYNTKQKDAIKTLIEAKTVDFSAKEICQELADENVSQATVYRTIDQLAEQGRLKKIAAEHGEARYQYLDDCLESGHCYLKCDQCGQIEHVDCHIVSELASHIQDEHGFVTNPHDITLAGTCKNCTERTNS